MRDLYINDHDKNIQFNFASNYIKTTKYTFWNFLPLSILYQYYKLANCYFLFLSLVSLFDFSPWRPITQIMPTLMVLATSILREGYEDF